MKQQKADRRSQRTYRLVSSAFAELMGEKPYDEILVQDILDRAGIGRTTFYAHYFDKEDVLNSMTEQILEMFTHQIAHSTARQRVLPSLELFEHIYQSPNPHFVLIVRQRSPEFSAVLLVSLYEMMYGDVRRGILLRALPALLHGFTRFH